MKSNKSIRLTNLRNKLLQIEAPEYPKDFEIAINSWIALATPTIRQEWADFFQDFQKVTTKPERLREVRYLEGSMFEKSPQESRRQWNLDVAETQELKEKIISFLDGLLSLPEKPHLSNFFYIISIIISVILPLSIYLVTKDLLITVFILATALIIFLIVGAFKLRQEEVLSENSFLQLIKMVLEQLQFLFKNSHK